MTKPNNILRSWDMRCFKLSRFMLILLTVLLFASGSGFAQVIGGTESGMQVPNEVKPGDLTIGHSQAGVDAFSGNLNYNHTLGAVSTPGGLSYTVNLNYSSVHSQGNVMPHMSGIPYGEGWGISIPSITINSNAYHDPSFYLPGQLDFGTHEKKIKEGQLEWFQPNISIPGVINERFIYKYQDLEGRRLVFVPETFEQYVEAHFNGFMWQVYLPDGTIYEFDMRQESAVNPSNQRAGDYTDPDWTEDEKQEMANLLMPKTKVTAWYVTKITNPFKFIQGDRITFEYETFGKVNYFKEFTQPNLRSLIYREFFVESPPERNEFYADKLCKNLGDATAIGACATKVRTYFDDNTVTTLDALCLKYNQNDDLVYIDQTCIADLQEFFNGGGMDQLNEEIASVIQKHPASSWMFNEQEMRNYEANGNGSIDMYKDVFLKNVKSRNSAYVFEELELEHEDFDVHGFNNGLGYDESATTGLFYDPNKSRMLIKNDPGVESFDKLYNFKSIYHSGQGQYAGNFSYESTDSKNFVNWTRYRHLISDRYLKNNGGAYFYDEFTGISRENPYICSINEIGVQQVYPEPLSIDPIARIDLDHSFVESPRFNNSNIPGIEDQIIAGEEYEIRTKIEVPQSLQFSTLNIDINISTGDQTQTDQINFEQFTSTNDLDDDVNPGEFDVADMISSKAPAKHETIFSTFGNAIKWNNIYQLDGSNMFTSNRFVMPDMPDEYGGFNIQIGPGNSDNDFSFGKGNHDYVGNLNPQDQIGYDGANGGTANGIFEYGNSWSSYYQTNYLLEHKPSTAGNSSPEDDDEYYTPSRNFGVGLPWRMVSAFGQKIYYGEDAGNQGVLDPQYGFWSNKFAKKNANGQQTNFRWPNKPTAMPVGTELQVVELVRHSKNPYMLHRVNFYKYNGESRYSEISQKGFNSGRHLVSSFELDYRISQIEVYSHKEVYEHTTATTLRESAIRPDVFRNVFLLSSIEKLDKTGVNSDQIKISFDYKKMNFSFNTDFDNDWKGHRKGGLILLSNVVDHLGRKMKFDYYDLNMPETRYLLTNESRKSTYDRFSNSTQYAPDLSYQVYPAVQYETVENENGPLTTIYEYSNPVTKFYRSDVYPQRIRINTGLTNIYSYLEVVNRVVAFTGFKHVKTSIPPLENETITDFTLQEFSTDPVMFGKLLKSERFDQNNVRLDKEVYEYEVSLAYENYLDRHYIHPDNNWVGFHIGLDRSLGQYVDYLYPGNPINKSESIAQLSTRSDRTLDQEVMPFYDVNPLGNNHPDSYFLRLKKHTKTVFDYCEIAVLGDGNDGSNTFNYNPSDIKIIIERPDVEPMDADAKTPAFVEAIKEMNRRYDDLKGKPAALDSQDDVVGNGNGNGSNNRNGNGDGNGNPGEPGTNPNKPPKLDPITHVGFLFGDRTYLVNVVESVTEYEHYDADYKGKSNSDGYKNLLNKTATLGQKASYISLSESEDELEISFEPSWNLYRTTSYSPQAPAIKSTSEYFYYWDLRKMKGLLDWEKPFGNSVDVDGPGAISKMYDQGVRSEVMQMRQVVYHNNDIESVNSEYFIFTNEFEPAPPTERIELINLGSVIWPDDPEVQIEDLTGWIPFPSELDDPLLEETATPTLPAPHVCGDTKVRPDDAICYFITRERADQLELILPGNNYLDPLYVECGPSGILSYLLCMPDDGGSNAPNFTVPYLTEVKRNLTKTSIRSNEDLPILRITNGIGNQLVYDYGYAEKGIYSYLKMENRDYLSLYHKITDSRGLITQFDYSHPEIIRYKDTAHPENDHLAGYIEAPGQPISITVHPGSTRQQKTNYTYNERNQVASLTDPNGLVMTYTYDEYNRLNETFEQGDLLASYDYHFWDQMESDDFEARTAKNYVESVTHLDHTNGKKITSRAYIDPLQREVQAVSYTSNNTSPTPSKVVYSGINEYDNWNRVVNVYKPFEVAGSSVAPAQPNHNDFVHNVYEDNQRSLLLEEYKPGQSLTKAHGVTHDRCLINYLDLKAELGISATAMAKIAPGNVVFKPHTFESHKITDEDGKINYTYTDALGRTVATKAINGTEELITQFIYDSRGNLIESINPAGQSSYYKYNNFGQMYFKETVDGGPCKYLYSQHGDLVLEQEHYMESNYLENADPAVRYFEYDLFGRPISQSVIQNPIVTDYMQYTLNSTDNDLITLAESAFKIPGGTENYRSIYDDFNQFASTKLREKEFKYDGKNAPHIFSNYNGNTANAIGRLSATISYNELGNRVLQKALAYEKDGNLDFEWQHFYPNGVSFNTPGIRTGISYNYDLQNNMLAQFMDLNGDQTGDVQNFYAYDEWNRMHEIYQNQGNQGAAGNRFASMQYNDALGLLTNMKCYYNENGVEYEVDNADYIYDVRDRMQRSECNYLTYEMRYDDDNFQTILSNNYNGNINGTQVTYDFSDFANDPGNFTQTTFSYNYDGINRLIAAKDEGFGTNTYAFDKIGNMTEIVRAFADRTERLQMNYGNSNNQLLDYSTNTILNSNGQSSFQNKVGKYTYDESGNLLSDKKKNISNVFYGRENLPLHVEGAQNKTSNYDYDEKDQRIYKDLTDANAGVEQPEYYLRDASGREVAILDMENDRWNLNLYAANRFAMVKVDANGALLPNDLGARYFVYDHLGNTRVSYEAKSDGAGPSANPYSLNFDGINDYVAAPGDDYQLGTGDFTMEAWIKADPSQVSVPRILSHRSGSGQDGFIFGLFSNGKIFMQIDGITPMLAGPNCPDLRDNTWHHVALSRENNNFTMYVDGIVCTYIPSPPRNMNTDVYSDLWIGRDEVSGNSTFKKNIDEVRFWNVARSATELLDNKNTSLDGTEAGLIGYWKFDEGSGTYAEDASPNGNHGTIVGPLWESEAGPVTTDNSSITYTLQGAYDYYPYGKVLREYTYGVQDRYLSTYHERDQATGYDYRGARFYDSEVGRFLSLDPKAQKFVSLSPFNYVAGNPIVFVDPDGKEMIVSFKNKRAKNKFITIINNALEKQFKVTLTEMENGKQKVTFTQTEGGSYENLSKQGQAFYDLLYPITGPDQHASFEVVDGDKKTLNGWFAGSQIDIGDINKFNERENLTKAGAITHEIVEQSKKGTNIEEAPHKTGIKAENQVNQTMTRSFSPEKRFKRGVKVKVRDDKTKKVGSIKVYTKNIFGMSKKRVRVGPFEADKKQ